MSDTTAQGLPTVEFLNRTAELEMLHAALDAPKRQSALIILRSPAGYGKSSLTDRFAQDMPGLGYASATVDPHIRAKSGLSSAHTGFFLQCCARALDSAADAPLKFTDFLKGQRWQTVRGKKILGTLRTMPSIQLGYATAVDYLERALASGRYSPAALLASDQSEAVVACRDYVQAACRIRPTILILREMQHIDPDSLQTLLHISEEIPSLALLIEYTAPVDRFQQEHLKVFERAFDRRSSVRIIDLVRLEQTHFERLLTAYAPKRLNVSGSFYATWDGDLRTLKELRFQIGIGRQITDARQLTQSLSDPGGALRRHIEELSADQRFVLACLAAHGEQIAPSLILEAMLETQPALGRERARSAIDELVGRHGLVSRSGGGLAFSDEGVAQAASSAAGQEGRIALAERILRDLYLRCIADRDFSDNSSGVALRQAFRLCARTRDNVRLLKLLDDFDTVLRTSNDPAKYVDVLLGLLRDDALLPSERARIAAHAANLAYDTVDFGTCAAVLSGLGEPSDYQRAILAQCHVETGRLAEAARYAREAALSSHAEEVLHAELVEAGIALVQNRWQDCTERLHAILARHRDRGSPLLGHAFRLLESTQDYPDCTETALQGVAWYARTDLPHALAYAEIAAARHLARAGRTDEAETMLESGAAKLAGHVHDHHIVWTARGAIELLRRAPRFDLAQDALRRALRTVRDDFSELVARSNLALTCWKAGDASAALAETDASVRILDAPQFSDRHVFWPVCYNLAQVLRGCGQGRRARDLMERPRRNGLEDGLNPRQWAHRYGFAAEPDDRLPYLQAFDYYPVFLSHWQVDREALAGLSGAPSR